MVLCRTVVDAKYLDRHLATGASVADHKPLHDNAAASLGSAGRGSLDGNSPVNEVFNQIAFAGVTEILINQGFIFHM